MNRRGIYSIITTFFLVATIIFVALGLVYINNITVSQEGMVFEGTEVYEKANDIKSDIMKCYGTLNSEKVSDADLAENCTQKFFEQENKQLNGFSIEVIDFLKCEPQLAEKGSMGDCGQKFIYYLEVDQNFTSCLGRAVLCTPRK